MDNKSISKKDWILISITSFTTILILLVLLFSRMTNKEYNNSQYQMFHTSLREGQYTLEVTYSSPQDLYLESFITSKDQEFVIWGTILPTTSSPSTITLAFDMDYSILNDSIRFRCPSSEEINFTINSFRIKSTAFPWECLICLIIYILISATALFFTRKSDDKGWVAVLFSTSYLFLFPIFVINIYFLVLYSLCVLIFLYLFYEKTIFIIKENTKIFLILFVFSLGIMMIFTTSSPLYPFNLWCDENIYYTIGRGMAHGKQLYTEMFDHKGPFFFALYMVAYLISPEKYYGVYVIESLLVTVCLFSIYKISLYFINKTLALIVSLCTLPFLLNSGFIGKGGSFEQMSVAALLLLMLLVLPFFYETSHKKVFLNFLIQGFITSAVFFSKFNVSFTWMILSFCVFVKFFLNKKWRNLLHSFLGYVIGWFSVLVPILIYFKGSISILIENYMLFNSKYGAIGKISDACIRIIDNIYTEFTTYKINSILILIGMICVLFCMKKIDWYGKIAFILSFIVLVGTTYAGLHSYSYYYTIIASYAFAGLLAIAYFFQNPLSHYFNSMRYVIAAGILFTGIVFYGNDLLFDSLLFEKNPYPQDIFAQQMKLRSPNGDCSFFECGMMEWGFYSQAKADPYVPYFFYPNINSSIYDGIANAQYSYIENSETEFIVFYGFSKDQYPDFPYLNDNYHFVTMYVYHEDTGEVFMLYQRNH